jgi:hypothetical protein
MRRSVPRASRGRAELIGAASPEELELAAPAVATANNDRGVKTPEGSTGPRRVLRKRRPPDSLPTENGSSADHAHDDPAV